MTTGKLISMHASGQQLYPPFTVEGVTHPEQLGLLRAIDAAAEDDMTPRLVYAEWLEERGLSGEAWRWMAAEQLNPVYTATNYARRIGNAAVAYSLWSWSGLIGRSWPNIYFALVQLDERDRRQRVNALLDLADAYLNTNPALREATTAPPSDEQPNGPPIRLPGHER